MKAVAFIGLLLFLSFLPGRAKDPFTSKEDAVGYIVIDTEEGVQKYIVLEGKDGEVKLIKTGRSPDQVLKKGGKKK
jgi:hypothetical protein